MCRSAEKKNWYKLKKESKQWKWQQQRSIINRLSFSSNTWAIIILMSYQEIFFNNQLHQNKSNKL
jgi:hypothetical protein